jgi:hypothetical protein
MDFTSTPYTSLMNEPTETQFTAYQQMFDYFNSRLFENSLPKCMLSFSRRRSSSHTLFTAGQWCEEVGSVTPEISLNLKQLCEDEPRKVMAMLVAQMVHLWQEIYGQPSQKGYYNREWAEKMAAIGLIPSATGSPGGRQTGRGIKPCIEEKGQFEQAFREMPVDFFLPFRPSAFEGKKRNGYSIKVMYRCTGCGAKVWGKGGLEIFCGCGRVFACESGDVKAGLAEKIYKILKEQYG